MLGDKIPIKTVYRQDHIIQSMQLLGKLEMKSSRIIAEFLETQHVGRIATIDKNGFPQIIPMNYAFLGGIIYMHSHTRGEKLDNMKRSPLAGFEVDQELEFLPSYFTHPTDASVADTLYVSVVMKGQAYLVEDETEKCLALNGLMTKYQPEGGYAPMQQGDEALKHTAVIKLIPSEIRGKYKIGQHMNSKLRKEIAQKILERNSSTSRTTLATMGFTIKDGKVVMVYEPRW